MFRIRDVRIAPPLILAPVAGHTDTLFRQAIKSLGGCGLVVSELISTEAMTRRRDFSPHITRFQDCERPISIQIFGCDPDRMAESAARVQDMGADIVDINLGCPVKKIVRQGGGSNLLKNLPLLEKIIRAVRGAISVPLTVKIRSGWDQRSINALEVLALSQDCGVEGLAIHGRTRCDMFSGKADWSIIAAVKEHACIPIIGNGDVFQPADAQRMFRETGVDGVMIGRGVLSNPWLIRQCHDHLEGSAVTPATLKERAGFLLDFLKRVQREAPAPMAIGKMKKMGGYLSKGIPGGSQLRSQIHTSATPEEIIQRIEQFFATAEDAVPAANAVVHDQKNSATEFTNSTNSPS